MSTAAAAPTSAPDLLAGAFLAAPLPLALLDEALRLVTANQAFAALVGGGAAPGVELAELLPPVGVVPAAPADGGLVAYRARSGGGSVDVQLSRKGAVVVAAVVAREVRSEGEALLTLGREVAAAQSEEALVAAISRTLHEVFPGRSYCVRIVDPKTFALTALYADGRLAPGAREILRFRRSAARRLGLAAEALPAGRVELVAEDAPIFEETSVVLAVPLVSSGQLFGLINLEHAGIAGADLDSDDRTLIQIANTASVGIRNAKLIDELTFVKKYLEELIENANALILVTNRERRMIVFNKAMSELSGFSREEVLGGDFLDFVPESERKRLVRVIAQSLRGHPVSNFETRVLDRHGQEKKVAFSTAAILAPGGEIEGVIAIGQDLTKLQLLESQVIQAEKLASLGQLAAGVVHEINNPLTAIVVAGESLRSRWLLDPAGKSELEKSQKVVDNAQRILRFTRDLISYARPSSDRLEPVQVEQVLDSAVSYCELVLRESGVVVERAYAAGPMIPAMKNHLVQVFVNLITNACHALKPGGQIHLTTRATDGFIEVEVRDTGVGIEPRNLARIFEPFFSTKADGKGTGLGLSIVQGIVEKHGGAMTVESVVGQGTAFRIRLPDGEAEDS